MARKCIIKKSRRLTTKCCGYPLSKNRNQKPPVDNQNDFGYAFPHHESQRIDVMDKLSSDDMNRVTTGL